MNQKRSQGIQEILEDENKNTVYKNLQDASEIVGRGKFIAVNAYIKKERTQINNLILYLKKLEKQTKAEVSTQKEIKIRKEINEIETRKTVQKKNHKTKSWFLKDQQN